jgi:hypothetical protein
VAVRDAAGGGYLEQVLLWAVVAILGLRGYLELTGYPQLGGGGLHIAHMLWGGLLLLGALVLALAYLNRGMRRWSAVLGGLGFGTFIDELGKFITQDNDYFYRPTIGLIYITLLVLFLAFRWLGRGRALSPREQLANAAALLPEVLLGPAPPGTLERALALLDGSGRRGPVPDAVRAALLAAAREAPPAGPAPAASLWGRLAGRVREGLDRLVAAPLFAVLLLGFFVLSAVADVLVILLVLGTLAAALLVPGATATLRLEPFEAGAGVSSLVSTGLTVAGAVRLGRSRREALVLFRWAQLVSIFFTAVFLFLDHELASLSGLALDVLLLVGVDALLRREAPPVRPDPARPGGAARPARGPGTDDDSGAHRRPTGGTQTLRA